MILEADRKYLTLVFGDLLNYEADDVLQPIDPLSYRTPESDSCLHIAAGRGDLRAVRILLDEGLDPNLRGDMGNTPLHYASQRQHADVCSLLVERGASETLKNDFGRRATDRTS